MKTLKFAILAALLLALVFLLGAMTASAAGEPNLTPIGAPYIDNQAHSIDANTNLWYRFDYALGANGEREVTTIRLLHGNQSGVGFEIYEPQDLTVYWDKDFDPVIGRGTAASIPCDEGPCFSDDLTWVGAFGGSGAYYVRVVNQNPYPTTALLTIEGKGVRLAPKPSVLAAAPALSRASLDDPGKAALIEGDVQTVPANSATWYRFDYQVKDNGERPIKTITLLYGTKSGMHFQVYSPEILPQWWDHDPIGEGTASKVDCDTGTISGEGHCLSDDLTWTGAFGMSATYYVRVVNDTPNDGYVHLTIR